MSKPRRQFRKKKKEIDQHSRDIGERYVRVGEKTPKKISDCSSWGGVKDIFDDIISYFR